MGAKLSAISNVRHARRLSNFRNVLIHFTFAGFHIVNTFRKCPSRFSSLVVTVMLISGCSPVPKSDYDLVELIPASGTITLDGNPLPNAVVTFDAPDGQFSYAKTNSSGHYTLQFDSVKQGVTPGEKTVRISTARKILGLNSTEEGGEPSNESQGDGVAKKQAETETVPAKYNRQSELKLEVTADQTVYDFELSSR